MSAQPPTEQKQFKTGYCKLVTQNFWNFRKKGRVRDEQISFGSEIRPYK